ncbi:MAG: hypothetical protein EXR99_01075 [Gemmataceae bacterium]|nr:hypothetical protein [Gemmataceae bacterium]
MTRKSWIGCTILASFMLAGVVFSMSPEKSGKTKTIKIGMVKTIFKDAPESLLQIIMKPFRSVMEAQTGMQSDLVMVANHRKLARQLLDGETQFGVFHGFEFGWAKARHPELQPLMLAVNVKTPLYAYLVVNKESEMKSADQLIGKNLAILRGNREHCRLFFEHRILPVGKAPKDYFGKVSGNLDHEDAFDGLGDGDFHAVLADHPAWENYKTQKPGRAEKLSALMISEHFVPAVIAYNPAKLDKETMNNFRGGMLSASSNPSSKRMLEFVKISSFEKIPEQFDKQLADSVKSYPAPTPDLAD